MAIMVGVGRSAGLRFIMTRLIFRNQNSASFLRFALLQKCQPSLRVCYKYSIGQPFMHPKKSLPYADNFLHMMFGTPYEDSIPDPILGRAMDRIFTLHADHEQKRINNNCAVLLGQQVPILLRVLHRVLQRFGGPAHGGANEAALNMLAAIGDESNIDTYIKKAKDKNDPFRLMGFGHRVYKNYDPRAKVMQQTCHEVLEATGSHGRSYF